MATIVTSFARLAALCLLLATAASATSVSVGRLTVLLGNGSTPGAADGTGTGALLNSPQGCAVDASGNLYFADTVNHVVRRVAKDTATTTTWLGTLGVTGSGTQVAVQSPYSIMFNSDSSVAYIPDFAAHAIFKVDMSTTVLTRYIGTGLPGGADGTGGSAQLNGPVSISVKADTGDWFVTERVAQRIRKITSGGTTSQFVGGYTLSGDVDAAGSAARFNTPMAVAVLQTNGNVYIADSENQKLRMADQAGVVTTVAGNGTAGTADGTFTQARFVQPWGLVMSPNSTYLYIVDKGNNVIRRLEFATSTVVTVVGHLDHGWLSSLTSVGGLLSSPSGICLVTSNNLVDRFYITGDHSIAYVVTPDEPTPTTTTTTTTVAPTTTTTATTTIATPAPTTTTTTAASNTTNAPVTPVPVGPLTTYGPSISAAPSTSLVAPIAMGIALIVCLVLA